jgi:HSP20 family protein
MTKEKAMSEVKEAPKAKAQNGPAQTPEVAPRAPTGLLTPSGSPFTFMRRFAEEMDNLFDDFSFGSMWPMPRLFTRGRELLRREAGMIGGDWMPKIDVLEREGQFVVRADLPGMSKDDVKVDVHDNLLTIQGERKQEKKEEREGYYHGECSYGSFLRSIPLPEGAEASKATADFRKGVLEVTVPAPVRPEQPKARRLEIREGK